MVEKVMGLRGHAAEGPDVTIGPKATLSLSLLLHELATNAIKYGPLSVDAGHVSLEWEIGGNGSEPTLFLSWLERGGPPARAPARKGFGSRLIGMGLVGTGNARLDYRSGGFATEFSAPLRSIVES